MKWSILILLACAAYCAGTELDMDNLNKREVRPSNQEYMRMVPPKPPKPTQPPTKAPKIYESPATEESVSRIGRPYNASRKLPSVRLYPHELHLCTGTFINHRSVLTTAKCIFGQPVERLFVHTMRWFLDRTNGHKIRASRIYTHPNFEVSPSRADVGIIRLKYRVRWATVYYLPQRSLPDVPRLAYMYGWKFTYHREKFFQYEMKVKTFSRAKCSLILHEYINCNTVCAGGFQFSKGTYDEGTPLAFKFYNRTVDGHQRRFHVIFALYDRAGVDHRAYAEKYSLLYPYVHWIRRHM